MPKTIQLRNVPGPLHRKLKQRAARAGLSLPAYPLVQIEQIAGRPSVGELRARLAQRSSPRLKTSPTDAVQAERDRR